MTIKLRYASVFSVTSIFVCVSCSPENRFQGQKNDVETKTQGQTTESNSSPEIPSNPVAQKAGATATNAPAESSGPVFEIVVDSGELACGKTLQVSARAILADQSIVDVSSDVVWSASNAEILDAQKANEGIQGNTKGQFKIVGFGKASIQALLKSARFGEQKASKEIEVAQNSDGSGFSLKLEALLPLKGQPGTRAIVHVGGLAPGGKGKGDVPVAGRGIVLSSDFGIPIFSFELASRPSVYDKETCLWSTPVELFIPLAQASNALQKSTLYRDQKIGVSIQQVNGQIKEVEKSFAVVTCKEVNEGQSQCPPAVVTVTGSAGSQ